MRHVIRTQLPDERVRANVTDHTIVTACLETLNYGDPWLSYYAERDIANVTRLSSCGRN